MKTVHPARRRKLLLASLLAVSASSNAIAADSTSGAAKVSPKRLPVVTHTATDEELLNKVTPEAAKLFQAFQKKRAAEVQKKAEQARKQWSAPETTQPKKWLRSKSSAASVEVSRRLIIQATHEHSVGAWASAEASAWEALRYAAEGVEIAHQESGRTVTLAALDDLRVARTAMREAREFGGMYGDIDGEGIGRMAASHRTTVLDDQETGSLKAADAIDRYLDEARVRLAGIATESVEAAQAMDLLAAIYLGRADAKTLPSSTALCLRRAAMQGQPRNASLAMRLGMHLADLGLYKEARWALHHSIKIDPSDEAAQALVAVLRRTGEHDQATQLAAALQQRHQALANVGKTRVPRVTELTPEQFAEVSKPVNQGRSLFKGTLASAKKNITRMKGILPSDAASENARQPEKPRIEEAADSSAPQSDEADAKPGKIRRFFNAFVPAW